MTLKGFAKMKDMIGYTAVIRTLGTAGEKYQILLNSLVAQTIKPKDIIVYIAEGYSIPKETVGVEKYIYVKKGMVAQRALQYEEVQTEYILFLDDDLYLPPQAVKTLYNELKEMQGDVISPCVFYNHKASIKSKIIRTLTLKEVCRLCNDKWAYKVLRSGGFSYNNNPKGVMKSQTNAGPCFFCKKEDFLKIQFEDELWLDEAPYALPEDQVMFYKMHLRGLKLLTSFDSGIVHLDAGSTIAHSEDREAKLVFSEYRNKLIFWHKFVFCDKNKNKYVSVIFILYVYILQYVKFLVKRILGRGDFLHVLVEAYKSAMSYIKFN